jgi:hypothetical protein
MVSVTVAYTRRRSAEPTTSLANNPQVSGGDQEFLVLACPEDVSACSIGRDFFSTIDP